MIEKFSRNSKEQICAQANAPLEHDTCAAPKPTSLPEFLMNCGRRFILIASACIVTSAHSPPETRPMKGMRAILFHGPGMPDIVRVTGLEAANSLYATITQAMHSGTRYNREKL